LVNFTRLKQAKSRLLLPYFDGRNVSMRRRPQVEQSAPEQSRVFFVDLDKLDEVFNPEVRKRHDAIFADAICSLCLS
jgi:hypothetical protein